MTLRMSLFSRMLLVLLLAVSVAPGLAGAQEPERPEIPAETLIETARAALAAGALDDAELLLDGVDPGGEHIDDLDFLYGTIALAREDWETAIARFRSMLSRDPSLLRVRLDLAFAFFRAGEDRNAEYHFRQALGADDLPAAARARALALLDEIRRRKSWSVSTAVALVPDSNINAATRAREIELFGLRAELSEDARQTSGLGLSASVSGGYEARISPNVRFRIGGGLSTRTYAKSQYNDRTLTLRAGPRLILEKFDLRPELTARARRLGGELYSRAAGLALSSDWDVAPAWRLSAAASAERISYETFLGKGRRLRHSTGSCPRVRASDVAARRCRVSPRGVGKQGSFVAGGRRRGFGRPGASPGVCGDRRTELRIAAL